MGERPSEDEPCDARAEARVGKRREQLAQELPRHAGAVEPARHVDEVGTPERLDERRVRAALSAAGVRLASYRELTT